MDPVVQFINAYVNLSNATDSVSKAAWLNEYTKYTNILRQQGQNPEHILSQYMNQQNQQMGFGQQMPNQQMGFGQQMPNQGMGFGQQMPKQQMGFGQQMPNQGMGFGQQMPNNNSSIMSAGKPPRSSRKRTMTVDVPTRQNTQMAAPQQQVVHEQQPVGQPITDYTVEYRYKPINALGIKSKIVKDSDGTFVAYKGASLMCKLEVTYFGMDDDDVAITPAISDETVICSNLYSEMIADTKDGIGVTPIKTVCYSYLTEDDSIANLLNRDDDALISVKLSDVINALSKNNVDDKFVKMLDRLITKDVNDLLTAYDMRVNIDNAVLDYADLLDYIKSNDYEYGNYVIRCLEGIASNYSVHIEDGTITGILKDSVYVVINNDEHLTTLVDNLDKGNSVVYKDSYPELFAVFEGVYEDLRMDKEKTLTLLTDDKCYTIIYVKTENGYIIK